MATTEDRLVFIPLEEATTPPGGLIEHLKDRWWIVHPEKGVAFHDKKAMSPLCNGNEGITRLLAESYPWAVVQFIPSVFRRIRALDYV